MTNAIETTKREMYESLRIVRGCFNSLPIDKLECALESHLEQLRQQYEQMAATARDRFESVRSLEQANQGLAEKLQCSSSPLGNQAETIYALRNKCDNLTEERDAIRNKLQAFEFANKSSGEFLIDALRKVKSQRKTIKALRRAQEARKLDDANLCGIEGQIASCRAAVDRWQAANGLSDRQVLLDIVGILREIPE